MFSYRQRAKYFDPATQLPVATLQAFRILREAYCQQLEVKGDTSDPEISKWIEWRQSFRQMKRAMAAARAQQASTQGNNSNQQQQTPVPVVKSESIN